VHDAVPVVRLVRPLAPQPGRTDIIAYIDNSNANASSKAAPFTLKVYGTDRQLLVEKVVAIDLPPLTTIPVYLPDVAPRGSIAAQAFLTFNADEAVWTRASGERPVLPVVESISVSEGERPRITATLVNPIARPFYDLTLVATVFDASGNVVAASQTLVPMLPAQGSVPLIFTWNAPLGAPSPRVEILPIVKTAPVAP